MGIIRLSSPNLPDHLRKAICGDFVELSYCDILQTMIPSMSSFGLETMIPFMSSFGLEAQLMPTILNIIHWTGATDTH